MESVTTRRLLAKGNSKLGESVFAWSIPAKKTCPGKTPTCEAVCYADSGRFKTGIVRNAATRNFTASKRSDFVQRMSREVFGRGVLVVRVHVSGDFYSPAYTRKWIKIVEACPETRFYAYTRSWSVPTIATELKVLSALNNFKMWYSTDKDSGAMVLPEGVREAWLQVDEDEGGEPALIFRTKKSRRLSLPLSAPTCAQESDPSSGVNCSNCQVCWT